LRLAVPKGQLAHVELDADAVQVRRLPPDLAAFGKDCGIRQFGHRVASFAKPAEPASDLRAADPAGPWTQLPAWRETQPAAGPRVDSVKKRRRSRKGEHMDGPAPQGARQNVRECQMILEYRFAKRQSARVACNTRLPVSSRMPTLSSMTNTRSTSAPAQASR